jgi:hypothetical protein
MTPKLKILVKFPTRSRPHKFLSALHAAHSKAADNENIKYLVSYDFNDASMTEAVKNRAKQYLNVRMISGHSRNKIHACNRDIDQEPEWDIVVLLSDDMICEYVGWDEVLRKEFSKTLDLCVHHSDGYAGERLQTMVIFGRKYYDRFGFLYNPEYISLFCDNEQHEVAQKLKKYKYFPQVLFKHQHYANNPQIFKDKQYVYTEKFYHVDEKTYQRHKAANFGL